MHKAIYVHRCSTKGNYMFFNREGDQFDTIHTCQSIGTEVINRNYMRYDIVSFLEPEFVGN